MQFSFYQIEDTNFLRTICKIIERAYLESYKVMVKVENSSIEESLNKILWSYSQKTFIPHGASFDPLPNKQPVYITTTDDNCNDADLIIFVNSLYSEGCKGYRKVLNIFASHNRNRDAYNLLHKKYLSLGIPSVFYVQNGQMWQQK